MGSKNEGDSLAVVSLAEFRKAREQKNPDYEPVEFYWGTALRHKRTGKYLYAFLRPDGQPIELYHLDVVLHYDGIQFIEPQTKKPDSD